MRRKKITPFAKLKKRERETERDRKREGASAINLGKGLYIFSGAVTQV